jgi:hypothetical protein
MTPAAFITTGTKVHTALKIDIATETQRHRKTFAALPALLAY